MFPTVQPRPFFATRATGHAGRAVCCIVFPCGWETVACGSDNAPSRHSASRWTRLCPDMSSPVVDIVSNAEARTRYGLYPHQAGKGRRSPRCSTLYRMKQGPGGFLSALGEQTFRRRIPAPLGTEDFCVSMASPRHGKKMAAGPARTRRRRKHLPKPQRGPRRPGKFSGCCLLVAVSDQQKQRAVLPTGCRYGLERRPACQARFSRSFLASRAPGVSSATTYFFPFSYEACNLCCPSAILIYASATPSITMGSRLFPASI